MTVLFYSEERFGSIKLVYQSVCTESGKSAVMYLCVRGIEFTSFCDFSIGVYKLFFSFLNICYCQLYRQWIKHRL